MSVLLETSLGDLVLELDVEQAPKTCLNFLKLCKLYKYNYCAFFSVQKNFLAQTGDPSSSGQGGQSIWSLLSTDSPDYSTSRYFKPERTPSLKHKVKGTVSMALSPAGSSSSRPADAQANDLVAGSQFFITLSDGIEYLDGKHAPFATVVEGQEDGETLDKINASFTDEQNRPLRDIRIKHVIVLEDPFPDPIGLIPPSRTPSPTPEQLASIRLGETDEIEDLRTEEEKEEARRKTDSSAAALTLELVGDLPFAEIRPPENILFVCKLNPVTRSQDLELIFSRFGKILSCEVIKDKQTGDSLQYAFIEFDKREEAEQAYSKMDAVLIDNQRIRVDFSQSVSKLHSRWIDSRTGGRGGSTKQQPSRGADVNGRGAQRPPYQHGGSSRGGERSRDYRGSQKPSDSSRDNRTDRRDDRRPPRDDRRYDDRHRRIDRSTSPRRSAHRDSDDRREHRSHRSDDRRRDGDGKGPRDDDGDRRDRDRPRSRWDDGPRHDDRRR